MNRNQLLLADLPATTWRDCSNLQIAERYDIPRPVVRLFRKEGARPAQPTRLKTTPTQNQRQ